MTAASAPGAVTTLTLFGFAPRARPWAFGQMAFARGPLAATRGLSFWKLLGSGRGLGFSLRPDFARYGLLAVWQSDAAARAFFNESPLMMDYTRHAAEVWTAWLTPLRSHGAWDGINPFAVEAPGARPAGDRPVAVLTRATIRLGALPAFWAAVPGASAPLEGASGLLASAGVGELPFVRQATFSLWRDEAALRAFAYESPGHREVIRRTRAERWYDEELFARFAPVASAGRWHGRDPLAGLL